VTNVTATLAKRAVASMAEAAPGPSREVTIVGGQGWTVDSLPVHPHPAIDVASYRLRVDGLVANPLQLSVGDLRRLPQEQVIDEFSCLEGWRAPEIRWGGVKLATVLSLVDVQPDAGYVQASFRDFSVPLALERARTALLAMTLNGEALPVEHGAPLRLLVPDGECFTSVKWLNHIELRSTPAESTGEAIARARIGR